ncbi:DNA glycosylase [Exophiala viscosa]|uniref:DNA glycosylase n=1 Tax=Exophiala viscosa TaxID=2486360 RepID=UPI00219E029C|nr:DNA glycosylase [Exophiala viscosa]
MTSSTHEFQSPTPDGSLSPPPSPFSDSEWPVIPTDELGMIADDESTSTKATSTQVATKVKNKAKPKRRQITYISRHFADDGGGTTQDETVGRRFIARNANANSLDPSAAEDLLPVTPPHTPARPHARIYYGINIDNLSSDSDLTDVPDDIGCDPFFPDEEPLSEKVQAIKVKSTKNRRPTKSPYFPHPHKHRPTFLSTLPFPPLSHDYFGLMQERLAHDPFRLLIATIFLNKTPGERAMPVFYQLMSRYPTPLDLSNAEVSDITIIIYGLGFQNQRARKCVAMAKCWIERPPQRGKRYKKLNYPSKGDGKDVGNDEFVDDDDARVAWEISHLPGLGPYSHDSWRMFCRDKLRGMAESWNGEGSADNQNFEPEWKRVVPLDKELRAWLTWMWMKEGWVWNKETGHRTKASEDMMAMARDGGVVVEEQGSEYLVVNSGG